MIVIEDLRSPEVIAEAVEAAASGHLVIAGIAAHSAPEAVARLLEQAPAERRPQLQATGRRDAARRRRAGAAAESQAADAWPRASCCWARPAVASIIAEGRLAQLSLAMDSGRRHGMVPLTDALVAFVRSGAVDVRKPGAAPAIAPALLKQLKREGIDTSFVERLA